MKKLIVFLFLCIMFYGRYEVVNLTKFQSSKKSIEVKGEVKKPGVYQVDKHATSSEVIKEAQGVLPSGDTSQINTTLDLPNNSVLVIQKKTSKTKVSLNSATLEELDSLPGVGVSVATRIIDYRNQQPFQTIEEIQEVKGIGAKMFEKLKDLIAL
ncbi:MAG: ComEA family DNA-binding protein [Longicatena sp.]